MRVHILKRLLRRYDKDKATKAERFVVDRWYDSFGDHGQKIPGIEDEQITAETADRIFSKIKLWEVVKPWYYRPAFQIACSVALLSIILLFLYSSRYNIAARHSIVYRTTKGQTKKILLQDSTRVWLNANSELEIMPEYAENKREVNLKGEAFFEVKHNPEKAFLVHAGELTTNVLGTSFTVQAYKTSRFARVTLLTGKVWVKVSHPGSGKSSGAMLLPDQSLQYDYNSNAIAKTDVSSAVSSKAWIEGKLIFDNTPMAEVAEILSRSFGLNVKLKNAKLGNCRIYGQFEMNDHPEKVVKMICKLISADYAIKGNQVEIIGIGCNPK